MYILRNLLSASLGAGLLVLSTQGQAEVTANIGVMSNYMWRGVTQSNDNAAVQGGVDYAHDAGWYVGTWTSNANYNAPDDANETEVDIYAGFTNEIGDDWSYDSGLIYYTYPLSENANFSEIYGAATWKLLSFGLAYTITGEADEPAAFRQGDLYGWVGVDYDLPEKWSVGAIYGNYNYKDLSASTTDPGVDPSEGNAVFGDYSHIQAYFGKSTDWGDFKIALDKNDLKGTNANGKKENDPRFWVSWAREF